MSGRVCSAGSTVLWDGPPSCFVGATLTVTVEERSGTMTITVLGIDLGKNSCSVAGLDESGRVVLRRRLTREGGVRLGAELPAGVMSMEHGCVGHHRGHL